ncbi:PH domain-containing protein [Rathayibacter soli]|uniref:PH domain-containing protein n=1 Tax=Rathayibacter soli TaxID=3144168 RepID=UPI0027E49AEE|nr:PH domain-containing protein [Glaciibacter superstes]
MAQSEANSDTVFISRFNRVLAIVIWALAAMLVTTTLITGGASRVLAIVPGVFFSLFAWTALWRPYVRVSDAGVRIRNVLRTIDVPWTALIQVDTRYALTLYTPGHQYAAWAAPAPGRTGTSMARRAEQHGRVDAVPTVGGRVRPGDLLASESGQAAQIVRDHWAMLRDSGAIEAGIAEKTRVPTHWHWWTNGALLALGVAGLYALVAL